MVEQIKEYLSKGAYYSAINTCLNYYDSSDELEKLEIRTQMKNLLALNDVLAAVDGNTKARLETIFESPLPEIDHNHFVGRACFPGYNEMGSSLVVLEASNIEIKNSEDLIRFKTNDETRSGLLTLLLLLWQYLHKNISAEEIKGNDVTVLNWGHIYKCYSNPATSGRLKTDTFEEINGDSLQFAAIVATISLITHIPVDPGFVFTGAFKSIKNSKKIGDLIQKVELIKREKPSVKKIVIPPRAEFPTLEREFITKNEELFLEVDGFTELIEKVFGKPVESLLCFNMKERHSLGTSRIIAKNLGDKTITIYNKLLNSRFNFDTATFNVVRCKRTEDFERTEYLLFPLDNINFIPDARIDKETLLVIDMISTVVNIGNLISNNSQSPVVFAAGIGYEPKEAQIFAHPKGKNPRYLGKYFELLEFKD
jgi:hypothetical protein